MNHPALDNPDWREYFEERAAIGTFDAGLSVYDAESQALRDTLAAIARMQPVATPEPTADQLALF